MLKAIIKQLYSRLLLLQKKSLLYLIYKLLGYFKNSGLKFYRDITYLNISYSAEAENFVSGIVFSKDRALQLYSFIKSFEEKVKPGFPLHILYKATTEEHLKAYAQVFQHFRQLDIHPYIESDFNYQTKSILKEITSSNIFFFVDDIVFKGEFNYKDILKVNSLTEVFSLRLGRNINYSFAAQKKQHAPENFLIREKKLIGFKWRENVYDWNYPLSVDGHMFCRKEIELLLDEIEFSSPNSLESNLQVFRPLFLNRKGVCFEESCILNMPINKVQDEFDNISGDIHQDHLLKLWEDGYEIDLNGIYNIKNTSPHQLMKIEFSKRS